MKTRKALKRRVESTLIGINLLICLFTGMMEDCSIAFLMAMWIVFFINVAILRKYGRTC